MKPRRAIWLPVIGCALLATAILLAWPRDSGPQCRGHSLLYWLDQYNRAGQHGGLPQAEEATQAVRQIGTNALPYLLRWLTYEDLNWRPKAAGLIARVMRPLNRNLSDRILISQRGAFVGFSHKAALAFDGFSILGRQAKSTVPSLTLLANTGRNRVPANAIVALSSVGPDGLPPLIEIAMNRTHQGRLSALSLIGGMGTNAQPAVPVLISCLSETNTLPPIVATLALGQLSAPPHPCESARAALSAALTNTNPRVRVAATNAMRGIMQQEKHSEKFE